MPIQHIACRKGSHNFSWLVRFLPFSESPKRDPAIQRAADLNTSSNHLEVLGGDERETVPPPIVRRPDCLQLLVKVLSAGSVEGSESAIHGPVVQPEEVHDAGRRERVVES